MSVLVLGPDRPRVLVFLPGFLTPSTAYAQLLEEVAAAGVVQVRIAVLHRPALPALLGHPSVRGDAEEAAALVQPLLQEGREVWVGGHSRGGQAAWLAAGLVPVQGLVLVDPVDGAGPRSGATTTSRPAPWGICPLIIGAGIGGRCAPEHLNHERFAAAAPCCTHLVVTGCGHADMLGGRFGAVGRRLCGGGEDPSAARRTVSALIAAHLRGDLAPVDVGEPSIDARAGLDGRWPLPVIWR